MTITLVIAPMDEDLEALKQKLKNYKEKVYGDIKGFEFRAKKGKVIAIKGCVGKANTA